MNDPAAAELPPVRATALVGTCWALGLAAVGLLAFASLLATRWLERPAVAVEEIVQTSVPAAVPPPTPAVLAPDPGDNP